MADAACTSDYCARQINEMDTDLFNPARKYKEFRPRMASRGSKATGVPTNRATVSLYNNSTGTYVLAVRDFTLAGTAADNIAISYQPGQVGSSQGLVASFLPTDAIQAEALQRFAL